MIWAIVSSQSCFCWLYRASPSLAAKNIINLISVLTIWWCPRVVFSCVGRGCLLWPVQFSWQNSVSLCPASFCTLRPNLENTAVATGLERSVFIPIPKKGNAKGCSNYRTIALISHASKVMLKILQARLQQYVNHELPDVQAGFRKGRGTRYQIANIHWNIEKARVPEKHLLYWLRQSLDCVDHNKLWKILKEMGIPDHLTCLLRHQYESQEATVRTGYGTTDWFQIGKGVYQGCILSPCLFNLYPEYIMQNARMDKAQTGIKAADRNINNLIYADDSTLWQKAKN